MKLFIYTLSVLVFMSSIICGVYYAIPKEVEFASERVKAKAIEERIYLRARLAEQKQIREVYQLTSNGGSFEKVSQR